MISTFLTYPALFHHHMMAIVLTMAVVCLIMTTNTCISTQTNMKRITTNEEYSTKTGYLQKRDLGNQSTTETSFNIKSSLERQWNDHQIMDMEKYIYLCMVAVTRNGLFVLTEYCIIPKEVFLRFSDRLNNWLFLTKNCPKLLISRLEVLKFASYYNVDEKTCKSVQTEGIPVDIEAGNRTARCYVPVEPNGRGMFTIDANILSSVCYPRLDVHELTEHDIFSINPFPEFPKVYKNINIVTDLFNIRFCKVAYGNPGEDERISPIHLREDCLASIKSGEIRSYFLESEKFLTRRCPLIDSSRTNVKYLPMVPPEECKSIIHRSVCVVSYSA